MMDVNDAMSGAVYPMTETTAFETGSVRRTMDSTCRMTVSDRYVTSIVRSMTHTVSRPLNSVALMSDSMHPC